MGLLIDFKGAYGKLLKPQIGKMPFNLDKKIHKHLFCTTRYERETRMKNLYTIVDLHPKQPVEVSLKPNHINLCLPLYLHLLYLLYLFYIHCHGCTYEHRTTILDHHRGLHTHTDIYIY